VTVAALHDATMATREMKPVDSLSQDCSLVAALVSRLRFELVIGVVFAGKTPLPRQEAA
jgi:hypothetical protein